MRSKRVEEGEAEGRERERERRREERGRERGRERQEKEGGTLACEGRCAVVSHQEILVFFDFPFPSSHPLKYGECVSGYVLSASFNWQFFAISG